MGEEPVRLSCGDKSWHFYWSERWGPLVVTDDGRDMMQPGPRSPFWRAVSIWSRQGRKRDGNEAVWSEPPAATEYVRRLGKRSFLSIRFEEPEGYDADFSPVNTVIVEDAST